MLTAALLILSGLGVAMLRLGWDAREPAQVRLTLAGWAMILSATAVLGWRDGAWGLAMGSIPAMLGAFVLLGREALASRAPARAARVAEAEATGQSVTDWRDIGRRVAIFVLSVPVAGLVSLLAGLAFAAAARAGGAQEADANVLALSVTPFLWSVLGVVLLLNTRPTEMLKPLAALGLVSGAVFWSLG